VPTLCRQGLRAEIATLWGGCLGTRRGNAAAWAVAKASKSKRGGREVPLCGDLQDALGELQAFIPKRGPEDRVIFSERGVGISRRAIAIWFGRLYAELGFKGASSHSG
jgi:integrase/recombinase XerD